MINLKLDKNYVTEKIRRAFENVQNPGEKIISLDSAYAKIEFKSFLSKKWKNWWDINNKVIDYHYDGLSFFSPEGFHFLLPAYMIYALENPDSNVEMSTTYALTRPNGFKRPDWSEYFIQRVSQFSKEQIESTILYLEYLEYKDSGYAINDATEALESYWRDLKF